MRIALTTVFLLLLAGCAATGPGIEPQQVTTLQKGRTTFSDVVKQFGKPSINSKNLDGTRTAIYLQPGNDEPGAIVSLATVIAGNAVAARETVTFEFDEKDVLTDYRWKQATPAPAPAATQAAPASAPAASQALPMTGSPSSTPGAVQPARAAAEKPAAPATTSATPRPAPPPAKKRNDGLPGWLPSGNYDPRDPFK